MPKQSTKKALNLKNNNETLNTKKNTQTPNKGEKKKRGAQNQYANKVKPYLTDIEKYVRCGVTEGQLCEFYGVGKTQWAQYKKDNPELNETLLKAKNQLKTDLINRAYQVAIGYEYEETTTVTYKDKDGNITGTKTTTYKRYAKADGNMIEFLLINRFSDEYARDPKMVELRKQALKLQAEGKLPLNAEGV